jgi:hypothetical protein
VFEYNAKNQIKLAMNIGKSLLTLMFASCQTDLTFVRRLYLWATIRTNVREEVCVRARTLHTAREKERKRNEERRFIIDDMF